VVIVERFARYKEELMFIIEYKHLTDGSSHKVIADNLQDALNIWDTFNLWHNHYAMVSLRPA
jgi:hypothetical protein